jgi:hypothetical protein
MNRTAAGEMRTCAYVKISGLPNRARASLSAATQNPAVSVFDSRQDSTRRPSSVVFIPVAVSGEYRASCFLRPKGQKTRRATVLSVERGDTLSGKAGQLQA